jgi:nicotinate phosphoribosyltransferase
VLPPGLLTDHYELTMLQASLAGPAPAGERRCIFELFARRLPAGRRYGVVAGTGRILAALPSFRFSDADVTYLHGAGVVDGPTAEWLAGYRFSGNIWGYPEGEVFFPYSPLLTVEGTFAECVLLETFLLSVLNHDCAIAAAASRMVTAAEGRPCIEMGSRRTHEQAAVAAARSAYIAGFAATSNLAAGRVHGVPTRGTSAHAFTLLHDTETEAFAAQVASLGPGTTLLIDTFDIADGARHAVAAAGPGLGAVRIDSGDLAAEAARVRAILDGLGARSTRIVVTSDLDEYACRDLQSAPIDGYGVGTTLVTGSGAPTAGLVYKLVARSDGPGRDAPLKPVWKRSDAKGSIGGGKAAFRRVVAGVAELELLVVDPFDQPPPDPRSHRQLLTELVRDGEVVHQEDLMVMQQRHRRRLAELPAGSLSLDPGGPAIPTEHLV